MIKTVWFDKEEKYIEDFLALPKRLYGKNEIMQSENDERELLTDTHVLSKYFKLYKLLIYRDGMVAGRIVITAYPEDKNAYIGFFECIDDTECSDAMFLEVERFARDKGFVEMMGPVDASFWIKYRLKVNLFNKRPYVSEPYNKDYYLKLFEHYGFLIKEKYVSNIYQKLPKKNFEVKKFKERLKEFTENGYEIISPKRKDWDRVISDVYHLIIDLYSSFPIFTYVSEEDFKKIYSRYRVILDMSMVKIAYYKGKAVGFFISMPDYNNRLYGKIDLSTLLYIMKKRIHSDNYVLLYMGVDNNHHGLGKAMTQTIMDTLQKKQATSIGALIKKGKAVEEYVAEAMENQYHYVLLGKELRND